VRHPLNQFLPSPNSKLRDRDLNGASIAQAGTYDETALCKLLLEISLLDSAYQRSAASRNDVLIEAPNASRNKTVAESYLSFDLWRSAVLRSAILYQ
jgi:hypothetical protein